LTTRGISGLTTRESAGLTEWVKQVGDVVVKEGSEESQDQTRKSYGS
jgi:hypothetical protein